MKIDDRFPLYKHHLESDLVQTTMHECWFEIEIDELCKQAKPNTEHRRLSSKDGRFVCASVCSSVAHEFHTTLTVREIGLSKTKLRYAHNRFLMGFETSNLCYVYIWNCALAQFCCWTNLLQAIRIRSVRSKLLKFTQHLEIGAICTFICSLNRFDCWCYCSCCCSAQLLCICYCCCCLDGVRIYHPFLSLRILQF